jgi:hypothetical protein
MADDDNSGQTYLYDAFISYRHVERDRVWAEWLIEALEGYRVPKALQDRGLPPRLRKVFRDEDEVPASSDLNDQILQALQASRFLIVVCSAFTPRSKWVEREIEMFNELGRGDQVLALLTEGEPGDSFPNAMLVRHRRVTEPDGAARIVKEDKEPLAADVRPRKGHSNAELKRLALLRLIAVILGVKFDDLRQRDHEREHRGKLRHAAVAAVLALLVGGAGVAYWSMMRPVTTYYRQIVWRWGVPEGLGAIDADTRRHLSSSYAVTTQRNSLTANLRVVEVRRENSVGTLRATDSLRSDNDGRARMLVSYREDGTVERVRGYDDTGRLLREDVLQREPPGNRFIVNFERNRLPVAQDAVQSMIVDPLNTNRATTQFQGRTAITRQELIFDTNGFVVEQRYQDNWGTPQRDATDSFGEHFTNSPEGLVLRAAAIGPGGAEITLKNGVRAIEASFDRDYNLTRYALNGGDEKPIDGPNGFAYYIRQFDRWGNDVATTYHHPDGKPAVHKDGYAKYTVTYDDRGFQAVLSFFDTDGRPTLNKNGYASFRRIEDERGFLAEEDYFGIDGKPAVIQGGFVKLKMVVDANGRTLEQAYFDADGNPVLHRNGNASFRNKFDGHGNVTETSYFGIDGKPTLVRDGYAKVENSYDDHDHLVASQYFGADGKATLIKSGPAKITDAYDVRGAVERMALFGVKGEPMTPRGDNFSSVEFLHDDHGNFVGMKIFGPDGKLMLAPGGMAGFLATFDERGNQIEKTFIGVDGAPKLSNEGIATIRWKYDANDNITDASYFDVDGKPRLSANGYAGFHNVFDDRGNRIEVSYLGVHGEPILSGEGIARVAFRFDQRGNVIEYGYFGLDGKPILHKAGFAGIRRQLDSHANVIEYSTYGLSGQPVLNSTNTAGWLASYDALGHQTDLTFVGTDGKRAPRRDGYAERRQAFDARGNIIERAYFDVGGNPTRVSNGGYAKVVWAYDARDEISQESYFGVDGEPAHDSGCVRITYTYDDLGHETGVTYWDEQNKSIPVEVAIGSVLAGQVGARAGLLVGDRVLTYAGQKVTSVKRFEELIFSPNTTGFNELTVRRGAEIAKFTVPSGELNISLVLKRADSDAVIAPPVAAN